MSVSGLMAFTYRERKGVALLGMEQRTWLSINCTCTKKRMYKMTHDRNLKIENGEEGSNSIAIQDNDSFPKESSCIAYVTVVTGDKYLAGTDSNISMGFEGDKRSVSPIVVNGFMKGNAFERNQTDHFSMGFRDIGTFRKISIQSDMKYANPGWFCDTVSITYRGSTYRADVYQWFEDTTTRWFPLKKV
jgi:hypothetical protein